MEGVRWLCWSGHKVGGGGLVVISCLSQVGGGRSVVISGLIGGHLALQDCQEHSCSW